jgi:hypothetical protein
MLAATAGYPSAGWTGTFRYQGRRGVKPSPLVSGLGPLQVSAQGTPNWSVKVANGTAVVESTTGSTRGCYMVTEPNDIASLAVTPADPTNTRYDLVVARGYDPAVAGAVVQGVVEVVSGVAAPVPVLPTEPANCVKLAQITVVPGDTAVTSARITDLRVYTVPPGGILPVRGDADMPASPPYVGAYVHRLDWHETWKYAGASPAWRCIDALEQSFGATVAVSGTTVMGTTVVPCSAGRVGQILTVTFSTWTTNGAVAEPTISCTVDGSPVSSSAMRFYRGTSTNFTGFTFFGWIAVATASSKTVSVSVSGGAAGSWTFTGLVTVG